MHKTCFGLVRLEHCYSSFSGPVTRLESECLKPQLHEQEKFAEKSWLESAWQIWNDFFMHKEFQKAIHNNRFYRWFLLSKTKIGEKSKLGINNICSFMAITDVSENKTVEAWNAKIRTVKIKPILFMFMTRQIITQDFFPKLRYSAILKNYLEYTGKRY